MNEIGKMANWWLRGLAIFAIIFGVITINAGGSILFFDGAARQAAGAYVPFVVWFNFLAGFAYIIGGIGLFMRKEWSVWLAYAITASALVAFGIFMFHVYGGGAYEIRTVAAMSFRSIIWILASITAWKLLNSSHRGSGVEQTS